MKRVFIIFSIQILLCYSAYSNSFDFMKSHGLALQKAFQENPELLYPKRTEYQISVADWYLKDKLSKYFEVPASRKEEAMDILFEEGLPQLIIEVTGCYKKSMRVEPKNIKGFHACFKSQKALGLIDYTHVDFSIKRILNRMLFSYFKVIKKGREK